MAVLACFIGIDRFLDPKVRDLTGARRDALGLWALFTDSLAGARTELLVDADATAARIRQAFDDTLGTAGPDDTVVLSFAGHGSRDHRLVVHDTWAADLPGTSIPMAELADRFRGTKARAVLLVLDCCFSGGAPARVFEDSPVPRSPVTPLGDLAGAGRVLIAACADDEYALEDPTTRHGLLTAAVMEALQAGEGSVQLATASDRIMSRVRAEALRMGYPQTPITLGYIEGGLSLPALRPGAEYFRAFPERQGLRVTAAVADLAGFGLPGPLLAEWGRQFPDGLNALQLAAVNDHRILDGRSLLVVAPTSSGKTFLGEMAAARADGRRAVFLFPYKALVNEKFDQFGRLYGERLGLRVVRCTGDYQDQTAAFVRGKYDLAALILADTPAERQTLSQLRKKHVKRWLHARGYNPTTANKALGAVKRAFNWAVEEEHIPKNPIAHVRKPKALTRDRTLTSEERDLVLGSIKDDAFRRFVDAMTLTGCRPGEIARVTAADVDFESGLWVLKRHKTAKKTGKPRLVYLSPEALAMTRELAAAHPTGPLFLNARGKPWTRNAVRIRFRRLRKKFPELKGVVAYTYRSSFATDALESGVQDATVAALLGHTNTATLHKFYARLSHRIDHLKDAAARTTRRTEGADADARFIRFRCGRSPRPVPSGAGSRRCASRAWDASSIRRRSPSS